MGLYVVIFAGSTPIGALFTGFMADWIGTTRMIFIEGLLCLVGVGSGTIYLRRKLSLMRNREIGEATEAS